MLKKNLTQSLQRIIAGTLLASTLLFSQPNLAFAQFVTTNPDILGNDLASAIQDTAKNKVMGALTGALAALMINVLNYAATLTAQSTAQWIVEGGAGKHPLFNSQTMSELGDSMSATITSQVLDNIVPGSKYLAALGIDPNNPNALGIARRLLMAPYVQESQQRIDGAEIGRNFGSYLASISAVAGSANAANARILNDIANSVNANEFYGLLRVYGQTRARASATASMTQFQNVINAQFRDLTDPISGRVRWPAQQVRRQLDESISNNKNVQNQTGQALVAAAGKDALIQVGINFATTFVSTLFGGLTQKLFDGLLADIDPVVFNPFDPSQVTSTRDRSNMFRSLGTFRPLDASNYSLVSQLASCPATLVRGVRGVYSCAMNTSFLSIISRGSSGAPLTLKQAIDEGYIDRNWQLLGSASNQNRDPNCHKSAFCYTNLVKMRKARIIPIGWEMAAELSGSGSYTIGQAMDGFYRCNTDGQRDAQHPFCKLIDPNWIIKAPEAICRTLAYGQQLTASGVSNRAEECVDIQTCIAEDAQGNCIGGYGYCVREKNVWRFRGDSCDPQYASCQTVRNTLTGQSSSLLLSTVDYGNCGPDDAGCLWLSTTKTVDSAGNFDWPIINSVSNDQADDLAYSKYLFANNKIEKCAAGDAGCSELIVRTTGLTLNMLRNPSFEDILPNSENPASWLPGSGNIRPTSIPDGGFGGGRALALSTGISARQTGLTLISGYDYSLSFYARNQVAGTASASILLSITEQETRSQRPTNALRIFSDSNSSCVFSNGNVVLSTANVSDTYQRYTCTFTAPLTSTLQRQLLSNLTISGINVLVDAIQLEQGSNVTTYSNGYSQNAAREYAKLPPDYLGCTGSPNDPPNCANFTRMCNPLDEGCRRYTPRNGDPVVTGIPGNNDFCPAACVGYDSFKQEPTAYEPKGLFPVHFIASTASACPIGAVGCDEFTNLATESREYFSELRACQLPAQAGNSAASYYTWEGSEDTGFQLRVWNLLRINSASSNAPCTDWSSNADGTISCNDTGISTPGCQVEADIFTNPDCRQFYDTAGNIHYRLWSETVTISNSCNRYRKTNIAGETPAERSATCRAAGGYFDSGNGACLFSGLPSESQVCTAAQNGCRLYTGGRSNNARIVFEDNFEGSDLRLWSSSSATVLKSSESLAAGGSSITSTGGSAFWTSQFDFGGNCGQAGGCVGNYSLANISCTVVEGQRYCGQLAGNLAQGKTYTLTFWARGTRDLTVDFANQDNTTLTRLATFTGENNVQNSLALTTEWRQYRLGPLDTSNLAGFGNGTVLRFLPTGTVFVDNITLREGEQNIALIRDSWVTPAICDTNQLGQFAPQFHLGCSAYTVSSGGNANLKSFSRLCSDDAVGCTAYFNTFGNTSPYSSVRNGFCGRLGSGNELVTCHLLNNGVTYDTNSPQLCTILPGQDGCRFDFDLGLSELDLVNNMSHLALTAETELLPADKPIFAIVTAGNRCNPDNVGCTEVGVPELSPDRTTVQAWSTDYVIKDMNRFNEILCGENTLYCSSFATTNNTTLFFRDPGNSICEYRTGVQIGGQTYSGWFRKGTTNFCYGSGICNASPSTSCTTDSDCRLAIGQCSVSNDACSQDADCGSNERCLGASADTCRIITPSYVRSGSISGIWNNGDIEFSGWSGECPPGQSGCRQFTDPLDLPDNVIYGQEQAASYYYIENANIGDGNTARGERCNGQFSLEWGCTLFHDTSLPNLEFNSSASLAASKNADVLFGQQPYSLVNPLNCEAGSARSTITTLNGTRIDLCAQRCVYNNYQINDLSSPSVITLDQALTASGVLTEATLSQVYTFGGSCLRDNDCSAIRSEKGDPVEGKCLSTVFTTAGSLVTTPVPRLTNDSNRVLKVDRDRTCAEWVAGDDCRSVWDPQLGQFRNSCANLLLCQGYESSSANTCTIPKLNDNDAVVDLTYYTSRDISWHGTEYSGYTIPNQFLMHQLEQFVISPPSVCVNVESGQPDIVNGREITCNPNVTLTQCAPTSVCAPNPKPRFALVYNAGGDKPANVANGSLCTVGFCSDTGSPCADNAACLTGTCSIGYCIAPSTTACSRNSDCGTRGFCGTNGFCQQRTGQNCNLQGGGCAVGSTCQVSAARRDGTWVNNRCLLNADGSAFREAEAEPAFCRAHPEINAPFGNQIVDNWNRLVEGRGQAVSGELKLNQNAYPFNVKSGFEQVNLCAPGEVCECSYKKLSTSAGLTGYIEIRNDSSAIARNIVASNQFNTSPDTAILGICSGGLADGAFCVVGDDDIEFGCSGGINGFDPNSSNTNTRNNVGTCNPITREDSLIGLKGYCLERDTSVVIDGNPDLGACLTWYPVDELLGETDLSAKYKSAGYFEDTFQCGDLELFQSITSIRGCSTERGDPDSSSGYDRGDMQTRASEPNCRFTSHCPAGFFAVTGTPYSDDNTNRYAGNCRNVNIVDGNRHWCPYLCVPIGSRNSTGQSCTPPTGSQVVESKAKFIGLSGELLNNNDVYYISDPASALIEFDRLENCTIDSLDSSGLNTGLGLHWSGEIFPLAGDVNINSCGTSTSCNPNQVFPRSATSLGSANVDYQLRWPMVNYYPGCSTIIQTSSSNGADISAVRTNVIYSDKLTSQGSLEINRRQWGVPRRQESPATPFGSVPHRPSNRRVYPVASCFFSVSNRVGLADSLEEYTNNIQGSFRAGWQFDPAAFTSDNHIRTLQIVNPPIQSFNSVNCPNNLASYLGIISSGMLAEVTDSSDRLATRDFLPSQYTPDLYRVYSWSLTPNSIGYNVLTAIPWSQWFARPIHRTDISDYFTRNWDKGRPYHFDRITDARSPHWWLPEYLYEIGFNDARLSYRSNQVSEMISELFAKSINILHWDRFNIPPTNQYISGEAVTTNESSLEVKSWDNRGRDGKPPIVKAVNFLNCRGNNCAEGRENAISVNGQDRGDIEFEGYGRVRLEFFAMADKDQLPLRRVIVDWSDRVWGTNSQRFRGSNEDDNFFKNFRGLDSDGNQICNAGDEWGKTSESCESTFMRFSRIYACTAEQVAQFNDCNGNGIYPCVEGKVSANPVCVYRPAVHIRDNWGWCGGVCTYNGPNDVNNPGCFADFGDLNTPPGDLRSECSYQANPADDPTVNPWVYYDGVIRVRQ